MKLPRALLLPLILLAGAAPAVGETGSWLDNLHPSASATAAWVDNASRTSDVATRKDAMTYELNLGVVQPRQVARNWLLDFGATADLLVEPKFDRNSWYSAGPRAGLQHKFGLGPLAPVLRFDTGFTYKAARIQANSGWTAEAGLRLSKRLNESFKLSAGGQWLEHYADQAAFDIQQRTVSVEATWDINERWRLSASAGRLSGRIVAHAAGAVWEAAEDGALGPAVASYYKSIPSLVTDSYGPGWVSYNVGAHADLWSLACACELTDRTTLELRFGSVFVVNHVNVRYPTDSWGLSLIHRF
jgi:hypothetical protein